MIRNDTTTELLISLIQRVPILAIDVKAAETESDVPAIAYQHAITAWQREATKAVAEIRLGSPRARPSRRSRRLRSRCCSVRHDADHP